MNLIKKILGKESGLCSHVSYLSKEAEKLHKKLDKLLNENNSNEGGVSNEDL